MFFQAITYRINLYRHPHLNTESYKVTKDKEDSGE